MLLKLELCKWCFQSWSSINKAFEARAFVNEAFEADWHEWCSWMFIWVMLMNVDMNDGHECLCIIDMSDAHEMFMYDWHE